MRSLYINGLTPPALAIAIALEEKGLEFEIDSHDWRETPAMLQRFDGVRELVNSLEGEFPILADGETVVSDSYFVLEYLDDKYPDPPLRPADAFGQWQIQALARLFGERALPAVSSLGVTQHLGADAAAEEIATLFGTAAVLTTERREAWTQALEQSRNAPLIEESGRKLGMLFDRIETMLDGGAPWLLGERFTLTDIAAYALVRPFLTGILDPGGIAITPAVRTWYQRMDARPAVRRATAFGRTVFLPGPEHARWG